jgi:hypothetical protein
MHPFMGDDELKRIAFQCFEELHKYITFAHQNGVPKFGSVLSVTERPPSSSELPEVLHLIPAPQDPGRAYIA